VKAWSLFTWCDDAVARARGVGARRGRADVRGRYGNAEVVHDEAAIESEGPDAPELSGTAAARA
jgi:hypothetical protein